VNKKAFDKAILVAWKEFGLKGNKEKLGICPFLLNTVYNKITS